MPFYDQHYAQFNRQKTSNGLRLTTKIVMNRRKINWFIRKSHRYLGLILGIQFLAWTIGGLYFSWTKIEKIRGEDIRVEKHVLPIQAQNPSLGILLDSLQRSNPQISFRNIQVIEILDKAYYQIQLETPQKKVLLFEMQTLLPKLPLSEQEAKQVAKTSLKNSSEILKVEYLATAHGHHEYREKPLPAYAITFGKPNHTTVYVSTELGTVQSYRNNFWRVFDFLWMMHTMDYENRDNINNWASRIFSVFGLITILSGFILYYITSKFKIRVR